MTSYEVRDLDAMIETALAALEHGSVPGFPLHDGRVVSVQTTPDDGTASDMAMGISALPPNYSTPEHTHRAEEIATVVRGTGTITIDDEVIPVRPGSIVITPPHARHVTTSSADGPLVVYWTYGPAGSEERWLKGEIVAPEPDDVDGDGGG